MLLSKVCFKIISNETVLKSLIGTPLQPPKELTEAVLKIMP
jgi:hypothetical protein